MLITPLSLTGIVQRMRPSLDHAEWYAQDVSYQRGVVEALAEAMGIPLDPFEPGDAPETSARRSSRRSRQGSGTRCRASSRTPTPPIASTSIGGWPRTRGTSRETARASRRRSSTSWASSSGADRGTCRRRSTPRSPARRGSARRILRRSAHPLFPSARDPRGAADAGRARRGGRRRPAVDRLGDLWVLCRARAVSACVRPRSRTQWTRSCLVLYVVRAFAWVFIRSFPLRS